MLLLIFTTSDTPPGGGGGDWPATRALAAARFAPPRDGRPALQAVRRPPVPSDRRN